MGKRLLICTVGLALSITLKPTLTTALQNGGPQRGANQNQSQPQRINQQKESTKETQPSPSETQTRIEGPITIQGTIETVNQPSAAQIERQRIEDAKPWFKQPEWWTVIVASVAALFAALAFGAGVYQGIKARDQAKAAQDQVGIMQRQFESSARAFLDPQGWEGEITLGEIRNRIDVSCRILNRGRTTATIQRIELIQPFRYEESTEIMVFPETEYLFRFSVTIDPPYTDEEGQSIWARPPSFVIAGKIRYLDGFTTRVRWFHRVYSGNMGSGHFHIPESRLNNEQELKDGKDEWEKLAESLESSNET